MDCEGLAPVVLFTYNRLEHTAKTIEALAANELADESVLIIYSDAAKSENAVEDVNNVRKYIHSLTGFKEIIIKEREVNVGLAHNIIEGVTEACHTYGRVIVLEDDIVTAPFFLRFMNEALDKYADSEQVMEVSGYTEPFSRSCLPETFFLPTASCWGWATWARAWKYFEKDPQKIIGQFRASDIDRFNVDGTNPGWWQQVVANAEGQLNTWAIFWQLALFNRKGFSLRPQYNMSKNVGMDGSGKHCGTTNIFDAAMGTEPVRNFSAGIFLNNDAFERLKEFNHNNFRHVHRSERIRKKILCITDAIKYYFHNTREHMNFNAEKILSSLYDKSYHELKIEHAMMSGELNKASSCGSLIAIFYGFLSIYFALYIAYTDIFLYGILAIGITSIGMAWFCYLQSNEKKYLKTKLELIEVLLKMKKEKK